MAAAAAKAGAEAKAAAVPMAAAGALATAKAMAAAEAVAAAVAKWNAEVLLWGYRKRWQPPRLAMHSMTIERRALRTMNASQFFARHHRRVQLCWEQSGGLPPGHEEGWFSECSRSCPKKNHVRMLLYSEK